MKINVLPRTIANMIAAGEVVERPASVVKELMENSVDAGASSITVEIQKGGMSYIRITDDGCGIEPDEVETAFLRHATSKIQTEEDLNAIYTLGFRGEALASIAAVARVDIFTKTRNCKFGKCVSIEGGDITESDDAGCSDGTTLIVRDLFFNTPARMKFLKNDATETGYVTDTVNKMILSHPEIKIKLIVNGKMTVNSSGDGRLLGAIRTVFGRDYVDHMQQVIYSEDGIEVAGYVGDGSVSRKDRRHQMFFINGRYISSKVMSAALSEAFQNTIMVGRHPVAVLMIKVNGNFVDVNVHPTKTEVRFSDDKKVYHSVFWAVKNALSVKKYVPEAQLGDSDEKIRQKAREDAVKEQNRATQLDINLLRDAFFSEPLSDAVHDAQRSSDRKTEENPESEKHAKEDISVVEESPTDRFVPVDTDDTLSDHIASNIFFSKEDLTMFKSSDSGRYINSGEPTASDIDEAVNKENTVDIGEVKSSNSSETSIPDGDNRKTDNGEFEKIVSDFAVKSDTDFEQNSYGNTEKTAPKPTEQKNIQTGAEATGAVEAKKQYKSGIDFVLIGQVFATYILIQKDNEMLIIDQHAAHERMYFEQLLEEYRQKQISSQMLLIPVTVSFDAVQYPAVCENFEFFRSIGFECEEFGENTVVIRSCPAAAVDADIREIFEEIAALIERGCGDIQKTLIEEVLHTVACKRALKGNSILARAEMEALCEKVLSFDSINTCPHGRPICISMTKYEMEKQFKRKV